MRLKNNVVSVINPKKIYGHKGEEVEIIRIEANVALVRKISDNDTLCCNINDLTEETQTVEKPKQEVIIKQKINWLPPKKEKVTIQNTLF